MEGGYVLINLADIKLFERLLITLDLGKPILLRDGKQNYFIDKITGGNITAYEDDGVTPSTYADIVLTSAIGTITIKQDGTITKASNPDTSELNAIKDYVDDLKSVTEIDLDNNNFVIKDDVNVDVKGELFAQSGIYNHGDLDMDSNAITNVANIVFNDESEMSTAPHLYEVKGEFYISDTSSREYRCYLSAITTDSRSIEDFNNLLTFADTLAFLKTLHNINLSPQADYLFGDITADPVNMSLFVGSNNFALEVWYLDDGDINNDNFTFTASNYNGWDADNIPTKTQIF